ncbi:MAG: DUF4118 domain-containing protein [Dorea sp.]|nr:DUF4118 domain-containing protein [Dorea sp.]
MVKYRPILKNMSIVIGILFAAYLMSSWLLPNTGTENNSAQIFVTAVVLISFLTDGYTYGMLASLISTFCINFFFMYPYARFEVARTGYPVAITSNMIAAFVVCTVMSRNKKHAKEAVEREKRTRELYERNMALEEESVKSRITAAKLEIRSNILMSVSHDLRTPLTAIGGSASVILDQGLDGCSEENLRLVSDIKEDAQWLTAMVENILTVTRLSDSGKKLILRPEILEEVIGQSIVKTKRRFPNVEIEMKLPDEIFLVEVDPMLIQQVFMNLLENAIRHSGSRKPIEILAERREKDVVIKVKDYGQGMPEYVRLQIEKDTPVILDRQGDTHRGGGIGLSVCQSILKAHGSRLYVRNPETGGCEFEFAFPMVEMDSMDNI